MKHLFTLNARLIGSFVLVFILILGSTVPSKANGVNDAGIDAVVSPSNFFCEGTYSIIASLKNNGTAPLTSALLTWTIVGVAQTSLTFTGNLKPDSSILVNLGNYSFTAGMVTLQVYSSMPNGLVDSFPNNDTITMTLNVLANSSAVTGPPFRTCAGNSEMIGSSAQPGYIYSWVSNPPGFTSNEANPTITPYSSGYYVLTVKNIFGCSATDSVLITVDPTPNAYAGQDQQICYGQSVTLGLPAIAGHSYFWTSSPPGYTTTLANPTVTPPSNIAYSLTEFIPATGCSNSHSVLITVLPKASATPISGVQNVCPGASSIYAPSFLENGYYYFYHFGDSSGSTGNRLAQNFDTAYVKFGTVGKITLWMISENIAGCQDSASITVNITTPPIANFHTDQNCAGLGTSFTNLSAGAVTTKWNFGDTLSAGHESDTASGMKTMHTYHSGGFYLVKLIVSNVAGCSDSITQLLPVDSIPVVNFSIPKLTCAKNQITFQNTSPSANDSFLWVFGDGYIDSMPAHTYSNAGTYQVSLIGKSLAGCFDTLTKALTINPLPEAGFTAIHGSYLNYYFKADDTLQSSYLWNFGDTTASGSGIRVSHSYTNTGLYGVTLKVTSSDGCSMTRDSGLDVMISGVNNVMARNFRFNIFPNPFGDKTEIQYVIQEKSNVHLVLNDITGKQIAEIVNANQPAGHYSYVLSASESGLKPGIYFMNAIINNTVTTRQIIKVE